MKRWFFRVILVIILLLLLSGGVIQVILWTDLPRRWVLDSLSAQLGMAFEARTFSTRWAGKTSIEDLAVSLPLKQSPFLTISNINLSHSSLLRILILQSFALESIQIESPVIILQQDSNGRWNLQDVTSTLNAFTRSKPKGSSASQLPGIALTDGIIQVMGRDGEIAQKYPITLHGETNGQLAMQFELDIPDQVHLEGTLASSADQPHIIELQLEHAERFLSPLTASPIAPLNFTGQWQGRFSGEQLAGTLELGTLEFGETKVKGGLSVQYDSGRIRLEPKDLIVYNPTSPIHGTAITHGRITLEAGTVTAGHLGIGSQGHIAIVDSTWDLSSEKGSCNGSWTGSFAEQRVRHQGTWQGEIDLPLNGRKQIEVQFQTQGYSPWGGWDTQAKITGTGNTWLNSHWQTTLPHLIWRREGREMRFRAINADFIANWPRIELDRLQIANASDVTAGGFFSVDDKKWSLKLAIDDFLLEGKNKSPLDVKLAAAGDLSSMTCSNFELSRGNIVLGGSGKLGYSEMTLEEVHLSARGKTQFDYQMANKSNRLSSNWRLDTSINGKIYPVNLALQGHFKAEEVTVGKKNTARLQIPLSGKVTPQQITFKTESFDLFDGIWQLDGHYDLTERSSQVDLRVHDLSLKTTAELIDSPLHWQGNVSANLHVTLPEKGLDEIIASGTWQAKDLKMPPFEAEQANGQMHVRNGIVKFEHINLKQQEGTTQAKMQFDLNQPHLLDIEAQGQDWPLFIGGYGLILRSNGNTKLQLDVVKKTAKGRGILSTTAQLNGKDFGQFTSTAEVTGRTLSLENINFDVLAGQFEGRAVIPLDNWSQMCSELTWKNIDLAKSGDWHPKLDGFTGTSSGFLTAGPSEDTRALGPLHLQSKIDLAEVTLRGAQMGGCEVEAYADKDQFLIKQLRIELAGGVIKSRATLSRHEGEVFTYIHSDIDNLDLNQLVHIFQPKANKVTGFLTGKGSSVFSSDLNRLTGEANFELKETDLVNNSVIAMLYNTLNLQLDLDQPKGVGQVSLRAEGTTLDLSSFYFFNRGVEVRGAATIKDISLGSASPIEGYAIGSTRPLKGINLPGIKELDKLMTSLQKSVASVSIGGTLGEPEVKVVPFPAISSAVRRLLWGQLRE
ncbi:MAG: AsmA-like C-terminal region-containing protein [Phycisphaerae bacterium]|nr:AsmA-like C-terminal region-containing protein [Phycisphaerae bacterium]